MTNKEIEAFNKTFGIETVFYYDDKSICGYEENNIIYLNLNSKKDLKNVNMHELLHFFEETEMFNKIKERVIKRLKENNIFDELKEEYELKYFGIYSLDEIEKGIIDNEIVIDVLVGDFPYFKKEELEDLCKEILKAEKKETDSRRYLILNMNNNIRNMNISKWEKIFASNYYKNKNYDGNTPVFPSNNKEQVIKEDIEKELNKLYNLDKDTFKIRLDSQSLIREYESELKALEQRGEKEEANYIRNNKTMALEELSKTYSEKLYEEYKHIVDFIKNANYEDAFKVLMLRETLLKVYKKDDTKVIVKQRKLNETIEGHMLLNEKVLNVIYNNLDTYENFKELYYAGVAEFNNIIKDTSEITLKNVNTYGMGKWIKFDGRASDSKNYAENVLKLKTLVQDTPWCTKTLASSQLEQGDFYVFIDNDNKPHIAVKMNGNEIDEVRGIKNGNAQELEEEYRDVAISFLENNKDIKNGENWLDKEERNKRLIRYSKEIEDGTFNSEETPKLMEDLSRSDYRSHFNTNSNLEELKKLSKIKKYLAEYYNCTEEEICVGHYIPKEETRCPYKIILGNVHFDYSKVTDLGELQSIVGSADFRNSKITNLGKLQIIGRDAYFDNSKITDLGKLQSIGGYAYFNDSKITTLGELQKIGGKAYFNNSEVTSLGKLQKIGGNVYFKNSKVTSLGKLQSIGGDAFFENSKITNLGKLQVIGKSAYFNDSEVTDLGELRSIGDRAKFGNSNVTNLGKLQSIGDDAKFGNSNIVDLGNLKSIGGSADFRNSNVTNLGELRSISGNVLFSYSKLTNLGKLQSIGGSVDFNDSKVTNLGELQVIGGNANFRFSTVTTLGKLQTIGGCAYFNDSEVIDLGELQIIENSANFSNSNVINLGKLQKIGRDACFEHSKITDLGDLQIIGKSVSFNDSKITNLGNVEHIGGMILTDENNGYLKEEYERRVNGKSLK